NRINALKGFVPTPETVVDLMVDKLFQGSVVTANSRLLDPGCGEGAFIDGVLRWCSRTGANVPKIVAVEANPRHVQYLKERYSGVAQIDIREADFLTTRVEEFDFIIGNPPYVPITKLDDHEK